MTLEQAIGRLGPKLAEFEPGHVWLAGAGPGNPGALTPQQLEGASRRTMTPVSLLNCPTRRPAMLFMENPASDLQFPELNANRDIVNAMVRCDYAGNAGAVDNAQWGGNPGSWPAGGAFTPTRTMRFSFGSTVRICGKKMSASLSASLSSPAGVCVHSKSFNWK